MDDNSNQDIYEDENMEKLKKASTDAAKKGAKQLGKVAKNMMKKALKALIKLIGIKGLAIIAAVALVIILLASFWWAIKSETYHSISDIAKSITIDGSGNAKSITSIDEEQGKITINSEDFIEQVKQWFKNNSVNPSELGLEENGDYAALVKFLEAEAVSSFPDLRQRNKIGTPVEKDELQGIVQFNRKYADGTEQLLEFKKYTDFRKELAKFGEKLDEEETQEQIYFGKEEVEDAYNKLKTYFTLDEEYNLIIVSLSSDETKITYSSYAKEEGNTDQNTYNFHINVTRINYQSVVQKYTMPFEFPLALLMITKNPEFCVEVAKLSMTTQEGEETTEASFEPKIVVDIQDNETKTYTKEDYGYTANFKLQDYIKYKLVTTNKQGALIGEIADNKYDPHPIEVEKTVSATSYKITENWINTTVPQLCVSEAITWIADYTSVYNKTDDTIGPNVTNSTEGDDGGYTEVPDYHKYLENQEFTYTLPSSNTVNQDTKEIETTTQGIMTSEEKKILEQKTGKNTEITTTTTTTKYDKSSSKVEEKWERFLSLLKIEKEKEIFNLQDITKNDTLIKYNMKGVTNKVSPENNLLNGRVALYRLLATESKTVTFEQNMRDLVGIYTGKIKPDEAGSDFSVYEPGDFTSIGSAGGVSYSSLQLTDEDFEILCKITSAERGGGTQQQQEYVTSVILNRVLCSSFPNTVRDVVFAPGQFQPIRNGAYDRAVPSETTKTAVRNVIENGDTTGGAVYFCTPAAAANDSWWSTLTFLFNDNNGSAISHNFYTTSAAQSELGQYSQTAGGKVVEMAASLHQYVEQNGYSYAQIGLSIPSGVENGKYIDCSSFVSWVLYKCGFNEFSGHQKTSSVFARNPWGWETVNSIINAKAGDILVYNGHVEIYSGQVSGSKAMVYNCGGNSSIRGSAPSASGHTTTQIIKIIRPPA